MITDKEILKKQIIYRSKHRGTKEMDLLLGKFVKKYINLLNTDDLLDLNSILAIEDEVLFNWYFNKVNNSLIPVNKVSDLLRFFRL